MSYSTNTYYFHHEEFDSHLSRALMPAAYGEISIIVTHQGTGLSRRLVNLEKDQDWLNKLSNGKISSAKYIDLKSFDLNHLNFIELINAYERIDLLIVDNLENILKDETEHLLFQLMETRRERNFKLLLAAQHSPLTRENQGLFTKNLSFIPNVHFFPLMSLETVKGFIVHMSKYWEKTIVDNVASQIAVASGGMMLIAKKMAWDYLYGYQTEISQNKLYESLSWLLTNIWLGFSENERICLKQIAWGKTLNLQQSAPEIQYLTAVGIIDLEPIVKIKVPILDKYIKEHTNNPKKSTSSTADINIEGISISPYLTSIQYKIVKHLLDNQNKIIDREDLIEAVWQDESNMPSDWALDGQIYRLRKRLREIGVKKNKVVTKKNQGYLWQS